MGTAENQATKMAYKEVESNSPSSMRLRCHCGQIIKKRKDSFTPGLHVTICLACSNVSPDVVLLSGEMREPTNADHRGGGPA